MSNQGATNIDDLPMNSNNNSQNIKLETSELPVQNTFQPSQQHLPRQNQQNTQQPTNTIVTNPPQYNPNINSNNQENVNENRNNNNTNSNINTNVSNEEMSKVISGLQSASSNNMTSLPSRDIPIQTTSITNDPYIQPNYIPEKKTNTDYIQQQESMEALYEKHRQKEKQKNTMDDIFDNLQAPIFITILFFIFQLPFLNKQLFKYIPNLFVKDGHLSFGGYLFKSLLFGSTFFGLTKFVNYMSEF